MGLATLQRALRTPLCLDESITDRGWAKAMLAFGSGRIINIKPGLVGGFTESLAIHDLCAAASPVVPVWCGGMLESGIGRAYNVAGLGVQVDTEFIQSLTLRSEVLESRATVVAG